MSFLTGKTIPTKFDTIPAPENAANYADDASTVPVATVLDQRPATAMSEQLATEQQAEKENEGPKNVRFDEAVDARTMSPTAEHVEYAPEPGDDGSAAAAVGVVTPAQQELLDYVEDLYEMAALDLITNEELEERKNAVIEELEASVLAGDSAAPVAAAAAGAAGAWPGQSSDPASDISRGTEIRAPGPSHTRLYTQRIAARLNLPDQETCDRLFTRFDHHRVNTLSLPAMQSLVADLWPDDDSPLPTIVERAFRGADLDEGRRLRRDECRDVLKCVIYLDTMSDVLADISSISKLTMTDFVDACAVVKEPITAPDAETEFRQLRDEDNFCSLDKFCMWLACRNVLDSDGTPTLAGAVVVPSGPGMTEEHATSTAEALIAAHEVADTYASTVLQQSELVANRRQAAAQPAVVEREPSVELVAPAEVQTDIPELVLGGESCAKVPLPSRQALTPTGTKFDFQNENEAVSWRTNREIERETAHRQSMERLNQVSSAAGKQKQRVEPASAAATQQAAAVYSAPPAEPVDTEQVVVDVEPVVLGNTTYLVDKANGVVYSNVLEPGQEPVVVGRWNSKMADGTDNMDVDSNEQELDAAGHSTQRWTNSGAMPSSMTTANSSHPRSSEEDQMTDEPQKSRVQFNSHAHIDVGSVPTVTTEPGIKVPLWSAGISDDIALPSSSSSAAASARAFGRDGLEKAPAHHPTRHLKSGDKLQYLASHGLEDWPNPNDDKPPDAPRKVEVIGRYHQKNTNMPDVSRGPPSPRSPRWEIPSDEKVVGRDLAPSSPRGVRRPIEDGIRVLRHANATKHTGNSHTPGVTQSRTLPPRERSWAGLTDDPLVKSHREAASQQQREENPLPKLDPAEEAAFNASLAMERRVLASDQQSWAYLSLQRMAEEQDGHAAINPDHFLAHAHHKGHRGGGGGAATATASTANYTLGQRREPEQQRAQRETRVSISLENNRYSDGHAPQHQQPQQQAAEGE